MIVAGSKGTMTIEGTVRTSSPDPICLSHRMCITAPSGSVYEVEASYLGLYLERFEGKHVIARVKTVSKGEKRCVVRISSLKVLNQITEDDDLGIEGHVVSPCSDGQEQIPCELGGVDS
jgi:hypothetical protein